MAIQVLRTRVPDSCFLHVPNKNWSNDNKEKQNYDEIERWSVRMEKCGARGMVAQNTTNTPVTCPGTGAYQLYVEIPLVFHFEKGRTYKITGQWPYWQSSTVNDAVTFRIFIGSTEFGAIVLRTHEANVDDLGGNVVGYHTAKQDHDDAIALKTGCSGTGPAIIGATTSFLGFIIVEDVGTGVT